jgi:2-methylcitrate dehydratase PrpD
MRKVKRVLDPNIEAQGFAKILSTVEVDLDDGRTLVAHADERYRGGPELPFTRAELHEKFSECASLVHSPERADEIFRVIESIERLADIGELAQRLGTTQGAAPGAQR